MKTMKKGISSCTGPGVAAAVCMIAFVLGYAFPARVRGGELSWFTSYEKAVAAARARGKVILADFTGSDWCGWCMRLKKEVFSTPEFASWAEKNVVLLVVDFPRSKPQSAAEKEKNRELARTYGIRGFPTILFLDAAGREIGRTGYRKGGAAVWIGEAEKILKSRPAARLFDTIEKARNESRRSGRFLCILVAGAVPGENALDALLADPGFIGLARYHLAAVVYRGPRAAGAERNAFSGLTRRYGFGGEGPYAVVMDVKNKKLLGKFSLSKETPSAVTARIRGVLPSRRYDGEWLENFDEAAALAALLGRPLFLNFTGSDWCPWCVKLHEEILSRREFTAFARARLVLVTVDFPRKKRLPDAVRKQNEELRARYGVRGFPTVVLVDAAGYKLGTTGYMRGGPGPFIKTVAGIIGR